MTLIMAVAFLGGFLTGNAAAGEVTVTATLKVVKEGGERVVKLELTDAGGKIYQVEQDELGKKLAGEGNGAQVKATGAVSSANGINTLKVTSYSKKVERRHRQEEEITTSVQNVFWEFDSVPKGDKDNTMVDHETVIGEDQQIAKMGVFVRSVHPVTVSRIDYAIAYPKDLLEFVKVERHWVAIHKKFPGRIHEVEHPEPGVVRFSWVLDDQVMTFHKWDRAVAQMFFKIKNRGEGMFRLHHPAGERWETWRNTNQKLVGSGDSKSHNWVYFANGTNGPIRWDVGNHLILRGAAK